MPGRRGGRQRHGFQVPVDRSRILLTGRSDGATWCYNVGLRYPDVFRAIAPVSGTLWPLAWLHAHRSQRVAVYIYHSVQDTIFPVDQARRAAALLRGAGHEVFNREDPSGSHAYTPEEAQRIADWFEKLAPQSQLVGDAHPTHYSLAAAQSGPPRVVNWPIPQGHSAISWAMIVFRTSRRRMII